MTLQQCLQIGEAKLHSGPHPERARRDAELLLLHVARLERAALLARKSEGLSATTAVRFLALVARRVAGEPVQYIVGETEFYGLPFKVTQDVLIPRPETELLVEKCIELAARFEHPRLVDVGAGSGAIAVALSHKLPQAQITAIDLSAEALAIAGENARRNGVTVRFLRGDLLAPVAAESFEIVVSNPPYVPTADRAGLAVEVRDYEPELALFAGEDGLDVYRRLIPEARAVLVPGGFLALEIGFGQSAGVAELFGAAGFEQIEFLPDLQGIARVTCGRRP